MNVTINNYITDIFVGSFTFSFISVMVFTFIIFMGLGNHKAITEDNKAIYVSLSSSNLINCVHENPATSKERMPVILNEIIFNMLDILKTIYIMFIYIMFIYYI